MLKKLFSMSSFFLCLKSDLKDIFYYFNKLISKINFKINNNIILIYFQIKNALKFKCYHNNKQAL